MHFTPSCKSIGSHVLWTLYICNSGSSFQAVVFNLYNYSTSKTIISNALNGNLWNKKKQCPATAIMRYIIKFYSGYMLDCLQLSGKKHYFKNPLFFHLVTDGHASLATFLALVVQLSLYDNEILRSLPIIPLFILSEVLGILLLCQELRNPFHNSLIPEIHRGLAWYVPLAKLVAAQIHFRTSTSDSRIGALVIWYRVGGTKTLVIWYRGYRNWGGYIPIHCDTGTIDSDHTLPRTDRL